MRCDLLVSTGFRAQLSAVVGRLRRDHYLMSVGFHIYVRRSRRDGLVGRMRRDPVVSLEVPDELQQHGQK